MNGKITIFTQTIDFVANDQIITASRIQKDSTRVTMNKLSTSNSITMGKDRSRSLGNIFWLYNFRVFETIKCVTFRKYWGRILELYGKAKSYLISPQVQFFNKESKKTYNFMVPFHVCVFLTLSYWATTRRQFSLYHKVTRFSDIHLVDQGRIRVCVSLDSPSVFEPTTSRLGIQHPNH